jgi:hypothetical protein
MNSEHMNTTKSTRQLKEQVIGDIQKVKEDFTEIQQRMTPGQVIDDALFYRRTGTYSPAQTFAHLWANPVGTTFLTLGTLLLMENDAHTSYEGIARNRVVSAKGAVGERLDAVKERVNHLSNRVGGAFSKAKSTVSKVKDKFASSDDSAQSWPESPSGGVRSNMESVKSSLREGLESAKFTLTGPREKLSDVHYAIKDRGHEVIEASKNLDPMVYLALGAGLGTITGAAIPMFDSEESVVDAAFQDKLTKFTSELKEVMNESVNILKREFIGDITDFDLNLFR